MECWEHTWPEHWEMGVSRTSATLIVMILRLLEAQCLLTVLLTGFVGGGQLCGNGGRQLRVFDGLFHEGQQLCIVDEVLLKIRQQIFCSLLLMFL